MENAWNSYLINAPIINTEITVAFIWLPYLASMLFIMLYLIYKL